MPQKTLFIQNTRMPVVLKVEFAVSDEEFDDVEDKATYKSMLTRDERRFKTADRDGDGIATREEFTAFLHPEEFDYMKDLVVQVGYTLLPRHTLITWFFNDDLTLWMAWWVPNCCHCVTIFVLYIQAL